MDERDDHLNYLYHMHQYDQYDIDHIKDYISENADELLESDLLEGETTCFTNDFYNFFIRTLEKHSKKTVNSFEAFIKPELVKWLITYNEELNRELVEESYNNRHLKNLEFWGAK